MKLLYKSYGSGDPVIILHGLFGMSDNWQTVAKKLSAQYHCIVPDLRNHGRSPHASEMNFILMANDITELMQEIGIDRTSLIGHSMGGKVAMLFALQNPGQTEKLVVSDIAPRQYEPQHDSVIEAIEAINPARAISRSEVEDSFRRYLGEDQATIQFLMKNLHRSSEQGFEWKANMKDIILSYEKLTEAIPEMAPFEGPVLFLRGENSRYIQDSDLYRIRELFPKAILVTMKGAGHWIHADTPDAFSETVLAFFLNRSAEQ